MTTPLKPEPQENVWFRVPSSKGCVPFCSVWDRRGWHLGWWDGKYWRSFVVDKPIADKDVTAWAALRLPGEEKWPPDAERSMNG